MESKYRRHARYVLLALFATLACNSHELIPLDEAIESQRIDITTQTETNKIDILWVIDNSNSMCEEQDALTTNFDAFISGLAGINADFHIAVVTTDMSVNPGRFVERPGPVGIDCADAEPLDCPNSTGPVLRSSAYTAADETLDEITLREDFRCIATVGTVSGEAGFERGLDAMATALSDDLLDTVNSGFRRPEAWLAIFFLTDENDCSHGGFLSLTQNAQCEWERDRLTQVETFINGGRAIDGTDDGNRVLVAGIIGPDNGARPVEPEEQQPSCSNEERGTAFAGYRYSEFIGAFGDRGVEADICHDDFDVALDQIARVIRANLATKCLRRAPPTCEDSLDCSVGAECLNPGEPLEGQSLCSDFEMVVEKLIDGEWTPLTEGVDFSVNWEADTCATGFGIEFEPGREPGPGEEFRIRYPVLIEVGEDSTGEADAGGNGNPE